jgi:hypothetical protein
LFSAGFKLAILTIKRQQTYALDRTATGIGIKYNYNEQIKEKETLHAACREEINLQSTSIEKLKDRENMEDVPCGHKYQIKSTLIK